MVGITHPLPYHHTHKKKRKKKNIAGFSSSTLLSCEQLWGLLTHPYSSFQLDFSIHLQHYSIFFQFAPPPPNRTQGNFNHPYPTISGGLFHSPPTLFNFRTFRPILQPIRTQGIFNHPYPTIQEYFWTCLPPFPYDVGASVISAVRSVS